MVIQISLIILQEFARDPAKIGIADVSHFLKQNDKVLDETVAFHQNFTVFEKIVVFLEDSLEAFSIISKDNDRISARPQEILKLLGLVSRARFS